MEDGYAYKEMGKTSPKMNLPSELGILVLRVVVSLLVVHHGLQKFQNPAGFTQNIVQQYFAFLPMPMFWTYVAATTEIVAPALLALGIFARLASFSLLMTMVFANAFHFMATGFEGFPLGVPATGAYAFEPSLLCGVIFFYFLLNGPGKLSIKPDLL